MLDRSLPLHQAFKVRELKLSIHSILRCILLTGLLPALMACQGPSTPGEPEAQTVHPPAVPATAATMETPTPFVTETGSAGLSGRIIAESDVSGQADQPLPGQMVLAVPLEKAAEILGAGSQSLANEELRFLKANLPQADPAITVTTSDAAGNYTLLLDPGEYVLCVADSDTMQPGFPAATRGCGRTQVPPGELRRVDISSGFGEILLEER